MENQKAVNEVIDGLYENAGCDMTPPRQYATDEEALADYGDLVALFSDLMWEYVHEGTEIENEYHAIERTRPLTEEENAEANDRLFPIRREVVRAGEALRAARKFQTITASTGMSAN